MSNRAQELFNSLRTVKGIRGLIGECEDAHFDCKEWPRKEDDAQKMLAKAICGLTNAEGGVLVIGMKAESRLKDEPDVVTAEAPISDTAFVKSKILTLVGNIVEPGIVGLRAEEVPEKPGLKSGFVVVYIPATESAPKRSRKDWKFYLRIGSGTFPMEYFQIEDMFGKRAQPNLKLSLEFRRIGRVQSSPHLCRTLQLSIANTGRGLARFPSVRFKKSCGLIFPSIEQHGSANNGLPFKRTWGEWAEFRGGVDDVVYPGETLVVTELSQPGISLGNVRYPTSEFASLSRVSSKTTWKFDPIKFPCEAYCEGTQPERTDFTLDLLEQTE